MSNVELLKAQILGEATDINEREGELKAPDDPPKDSEESSGQPKSQEEKPLNLAKYKPRKQARKPFHPTKYKPKKQKLPHKHLRSYADEIIRKYNELGIADNPIPEIYDFEDERLELIELFEDGSNIDDAFELTGYARPAIEAVYKEWVDSKKNSVEVGDNVCSVLNFEGHETVIFNGTILQKLNNSVIIATNCKYIKDELNGVVCMSYKRILKL